MEMSRSHYGSGLESSVEIDRRRGKMENIQEKTSWKTGFFYSFGEIGGQLSWYMINSYLTIFYTDVVGLTAQSV